MSKDKQTRRDERDAIIALYFVDPEAASRLAVSRGFVPGYPHKLARERGLIPLPPRPYKRKADDKPL